MALATNTSPGEIQLAGDLGGNNNATAPELSATGVTPGAYSLVNLTVDTKGRITAIADSDPSNLADLIPDATTSVKGVVQVGAGLEITTVPTSGLQDILFTISITGPESTGLDTCANYKIDIQIDNGTPINIITTGSNLQTMTDVVNVFNGALANAVVSIADGKMTITSDSTGKLSSVDIFNDQLFSCMGTFSAIPTAVSGTGDCELSAIVGTNATKGILQAGSGLSVTDGVISVSGSATLDPATELLLGGVIVPTAGNLDVDVSGNISVPLATGSTVGVISVGTGLSVSAGVLSADAVSDATPTTKGIVSVPVNGNIDVSAGEISVPLATGNTGSPGGSVVGVVSIGGGLQINGAGLLQIDSSTFPVATTTTIGAVIVPTSGNIDVDGSGNISVPLATGAVVGVISGGTDVDIDGSGVLSVPIATISSRGIVQVGDGLLIDGGGVLDIDFVPATTTTIGFVKVPSAGNIDVDGSGNISIPLANGTVTKGIVSSINANNIIISNGDIDVGTNVALLTAQNTWQKTQSAATHTLGAGTHVLSTSNIHKLDTAVNTTGAFSSMVNGTWYTVYIDNTTSFVGFPFSTTNMKFRGGAIPNISTSGISILSMFAYSGTLYSELSKGFA